MLSLIDLLGRAAPILRIVDVGAMWLGEEDLAYRTLLRPGKFEVVGFEPVQAECDKLNAMGRKGHRYLPYFIGDGSARTFHLCNFSMTSSLYAPNARLINLVSTLPELMQVTAREPVQTRRLDDIPEITGMDLLKIDVQGAETDCFRGAPRLLGGAVAVQTEVNFVPLYKDQPLFADVDAELRRHGYLLHALQPIHSRCIAPLVNPNNPSTGINQVLWTDAVYFRDFSKLSELTADQLIRLAVIAHELVGSYDLASLALYRYDEKTKAGLWPVYMKRLTGAVPPPPPPENPD